MKKKNGKHGETKYVPASWKQEETKDYQTWEVGGMIMLIEKNLKEALADYIKGKPVTVLWTRDDGSMDVRLLSDILEQEENHFLVNVPAYHKPEFAQAVAEMIEQQGTADCSRKITPVGITEKDGSTIPPVQSRIRL